VFAFAILFRYMFTYKGVINQMISLTKIAWFGTRFFAQLMIAIALSWISIGYLLLIYTNSLKSIPKYYYEAFSIESKSYIQRLFSVQIPLTLPALKSILFMICLEVFSLIDLPLNLTEGAPQNSTVTTAYYIYKTSIEYF